MNPNIPYSQHHRSSQLLEKHNKIRFVRGLYLQLLISQRAETIGTITLSSQTSLRFLPQGTKEGRARHGVGLQEALMSPNDVT